MKLAQVDQLFTGFRLATMALPGTVLGTDLDGTPLLSAGQSCFGEIPDAVIGVANGRIAWIVPRSMLLEPDGQGPVEVIDGHGRWITPGLVDCHTHLVYGGNRANEWESRLNGVPYAEIARQGGGILSSVRSTRDASEDELVRSARGRLERLMSEGVTTVEIKSGYGLDVETELKMLRAARRLEAEMNVRVVTTLLAAHAVPPEFKGRTDDYVDLVCKKIIPAAKELCTAVDAFCESIAFDCAQTTRVFQAAIDEGLRIKVHAEQLTYTGMAVIAAEMGALSVDHIEYLPDRDCETLARCGTVATLLPGAFYCLRETRLPPVAALRQAGVPIAISTDSNPGSSPVVSLLLMGNMACNLFGLTCGEALAGMTRNAAMALGLQGEVGTLQPGCVADLAVWNVGSPPEILYGIGHNPCVAVYKNGKRTL